MSNHNINIDHNLTCEQANKLLSTGFLLSNLEWDEMKPEEVIDIIKNLSEYVLEDE